MKTKLSKSAAKDKIDEFFNNINGKTPKEVKKIKNLAMSFNIPLKERRKTFCKKCLNPYVNPKIRIKNKIKSTKCEKCGHISRWKIKE